ncbi:MAG: hypothetical protein ACPLW7_00755 [Minisyncoccia bacterium]
MQGLFLGVIIGAIALIINIIINGISSSYVYYSNYLFLSGVFVGLLGGVLFISHWFTDRKFYLQYFIKDELDKKREEIEYMFKLGGKFVIAGLFLIFLSFVIIYI